ncbi:unnamed protein product [Urochloa humidicola]
MAQFHLLDPVYDETHRGRRIAGGEALHILRPRTHKGFLDMRYDDRYTPLLERAGLDAISFLVRRGLPPFNSAALTALVDRWRPETHTFHLPFGEMTVTLQDCQKMLGLKIDGRPVIGPCRSEGWRARVQAFLGRELPDEHGSRTSGVSIAWLREAFGQCPVDANEETIGYYCRAWILHLFGCILFPDGTGDAASWMYIHCLTDWDQAGMYSWASAVLAFLYRHLCEACRRTSTTGSLGGCVYLLQLWMWSRLPVGRPKILPREEWWAGVGPKQFPTVGYFWSKVSVPFGRTNRAYREFTDEIDRLTASCVNWEPYEGEAAHTFALSMYCSRDEDIYRLKCPLICFYAVEYHLPHRVARQFGRRQLWPVQPFSTSVELHKLDRQKQKKIVDWETQHRDYIEEWEMFGENVDDNEEPHTNSAYRAYQAWYQCSTRCRLRVEWTQADYADIESSDDEDTTYDQDTRKGTLVEAGPLLDRVGNTLKRSVQDIEHFRPRLRDGCTVQDMESFLDRLYTRFRRAAARCGCRTMMQHNVHDPSTTTGSSSHALTFEDDDHEVQHMPEEIGPSQLVDAPSTQPSPRRRHAAPSRYTPGTDALGKVKGKGKVRKMR